MAYTIVFIDEREHLLQSFRRTVPNDELHLIRVANGEEGARTARDIRPDAIVLSADIPNGFAACRTLKKDIELSGVPIVLVSEQIDATTFEKHSSLPTRADAYLRGDLSGERLAETLGEFLPLLGRGLELAGGNPMPPTPPPLSGGGVPQTNPEHLEALRQAVNALGASEARVDELNDALTKEKEARKKSEALSSQYMDALAQQGDSLQSLEERIRSLETEIDTTEESRQTAQTVVAEREASLQAIMEENQQLKSEMETKLESRSASAERVAQQLSSVAQELEKAQEEAQETTSQAQGLSDELTGLRSALEESSAQILQMQEVNAALQETLGLKEQESEQLKEVMETQRLTTTGAQTELRDMVQSRDELSASLEAKKQEAADLEGTIIALSEQQTQLTKALQATEEQGRQQEEALEQQASEWAAKETEYEGKHAEFEREAEGFRATQAEHLKAIASLQEQENQLSEDLRSARVSGEELLKELTSRDASLQLNEAKVQELEVEKTGLHSGLQGWRERAERVEQALQTVSGRLQQGSEAFLSLARECEAVTGERSGNDVPETEEGIEEKGDTQESATEEAPPENGEQGEEPLEGDGEPGPPPPPSP
jgi:chromosome segregation ATPase